MTNIYIGPKILIKYSEMVLMTFVAFESKDFPGYFDIVKNRVDGNCGSTVHKYVIGTYISILLKGIK